MWLFLLTEIMFFGGMFFAYLLYRNWYYDAFVAGSHQLRIWAGTQYRHPDHLGLLYGAGCLAADGAQRTDRLAPHHALLGSLSSASRIMSGTTSGCITTFPG